jgi:nucleoid DNA-binding protein
MTKKEMAKAIASDLGLRPADVLVIVQKLFDGITATLVQEGRIEFRNFGVFEVKSRKPRKARNPRTGESVQVPERRVVSFKPGKEMEERVGQSKHEPAQAMPMAPKPCKEEKKTGAGLTKRR